MHPTIPLIRAADRRSVVDVLAYPPVGCVEYSDDAHAFGNPIHHSVDFGEATSVAVQQNASRKYTSRSRTIRLVDAANRSVGKQIHLLLATVHSLHIEDLHRTAL